MDATNATVSALSLMDLNVNFLSGLSCGLCLGISFYVFGTYFSGAPAPPVVPAVKKPAKRFKSKSEFKMVIVVRNDLKMTKGMIMSHCCHAAVGAFEEISQTDPITLRIWQSTGQAKVAVKCNSIEEINKIVEDCEKEGIVFFKVMDDSKTQGESGTLTCLAVGPAPKDVIDTVTGTLKLL